MVSTSRFLGGGSTMRGEDVFAAGLFAPWNMLIRRFRYDWRGRGLGVAPIATAAAAAAATS